MPPATRCCCGAAGKDLTVESPEGIYLGEVEPRQGQRLARLMQGGNRYEAAVTSVQEDSLVIMVRETYQHSSQQGVMSFPYKQPMGRRPTHTWAAHRCRWR